MGTELYHSKYLHAWTYPKSDYGGEDLTGWYVLASKTRDSDILEESNYDCILKEIAENPSALEDKHGLLVAEFGHWACGWFRLLLIHESDTELLIRGDGIKEKLDDYPVYDEEDYSRREIEAQYSLVEDEVRYWNNKQDEPLTEEQKENLVYRLVQESNEFDYCPTKQEIEETWSNMQNEKHCAMCDRDFNPVLSRYCDCQPKLV